MTMAVFHDFTHTLGKEKGAPVVKKKRDVDLIVPPTCFIGELFPFKGRWWKVQIWDPAGGMIKFYGDSTNQEVNAVCRNPIMVLEMQGECGQAAKRRLKHGSKHTN